VRERLVDYGLVIPTSEKPPVTRKLDELETTTVWILPETDFEERLNKNVIDRYSNAKGYSTITFVSHSKNETNSTERNRQKGKELLFIKSPFLSNNSSRSNIEHYLKETKEIVNRELPSINKGGFLAIQTQDIRIDGYIEPLAKRMLDLLISGDLWLKEVVIVTQRAKKNLGSESTGEYLKITHQYLLVYEVVG
jgi:hypothetical protein